MKAKPSLVLIDGNKLPDLKNYKLEYVIKAVSGNTKIECFNDWVIELKKNPIIFIIIRECGLQVFGYLPQSYLGNKNLVFYEIFI